jgi:RDD family
MTDGKVPGGLTIAPLWRRLAASAIDSAVLGPPVSVVSVGAGALYVRFERDSEFDPPRPFAPSGWWNVPIWLSSGAAAVWVRNRRGPGYRALGLRRVDIHTGGRVSVRSALIQQAVIIASGESIRQALRPWERRSRPDGRAGAKRRATDASSARRQAVGSCGPSLAAATVIQTPAFWSPRNQTFGERLAGTVVVTA